MQPLGGQPSYCVREGFGARFKPRTALLGDAPAAAKTAFGAHLPIGVFAAEGYLGAYSHGAVRSVNVLYRKSYKIPVLILSCPAAPVELYRIYRGSIGSPFCLMSVLKLSLTLHSI